MASETEEIPHSQEALDAILDLHDLDKANSVVDNCGQFENLLATLPPCAQSLTSHHVSTCANAPFTSTQSFINQVMTSPRTSFNIVTEILASQEAETDLLESPTSQDYPGNFGFSVTLPNKSDEKITKAMSWTYCTQLNKLFCMPEVAVPFHFQFNKDMPATATIRACVVPSTHNFIVVRCPGHSDGVKENGKHFLACSNAKAVYGSCRRTGIHSILVPAAPYQTGLDYMEIKYSFHCYSSCPGIAKRDLKILFTLEDRGKILGRAGTDLKVCACPGRDRTEFERRKNKTTKRENKVVRAKIPKSSSESDSEHKFYTITVEGKRKFRRIAEYAHGLNYIYPTSAQNLPAGELTPLSRTESGGVENWVLLNGQEIKMEKKFYPEESEEKPLKKPKL